MKGLFLLFSFFLVSTVSYPQQSLPVFSGQSKITGKVVDSASKQAVEYATITLVDENSKKAVNGAITDNKGQFSIFKIVQGIYTIEVGSVGYENYYHKGFLLKGKANDTILNEILLVKSRGALQSVIVTGTKQTIENKIDKIVYNVDKDITSQGGVATDALKKIPGVTVDVDGNIELLGNASIRFLIDGKPSGLFGNSVADALQSIPNSQIQSIEVLTSPSVKYDASGTGGIINIILKKSKFEGFNGNISLAAGSRLENGSFTINFKRNHLRLNAFYSGNAQLKAGTPTGMNRTTTNNSGELLSQLLQGGSTHLSRNSYNTGLGLEWVISGKSSLAATLNYHHFANNNDGNTDQLLSEYDSLGNTISIVNSTLFYKNSFSLNTLDNSLVFRKKLNKNQGLEISYAGSFGRNTTYYNQSQYYKADSAAFSGSNSLNPGSDNETDFSIEYTDPVKDNFLLETGLKTVIQSIISNADVFTLNAPAGNYIKDNMQSYSSDYHRTIYAGYASATFSLFKYFDLVSGVRYEYTLNKASYSNAKNVTIPDYANLAPSLVISRRFRNQQTLKFAYAYRLERPDYRDLNPFMNLSDPHNITTGNPNLQPEIGHNYQLSYNKAYESGSNINVLLYQERIIPDIKPYITYYPVYKIGDSSYTDVSLTSRANISHEIKTGVNISVSTLAGKKLIIRSNALFFNRNFKNIYAAPVITNSFGYRLNLSLSYQFNKKFVAEGFGNYYSGTRWQGRQPSSYSYTIAFRKQFLKNKGSFGVIAVNALSKYITQKSLLTPQNEIINSYRNLPYRSFGISVSYKFGKLKVSKLKESENYLNFSPPAEN